MRSPATWRWTRLENALACGPGKFDAGGVWDGSMTFLDAKTPIIFYDAVPMDRRPHARARGARSERRRPSRPRYCPAGGPLRPIAAKVGQGPSESGRVYPKSCGSGPCRSGATATRTKIVIRDGKEARYTSNDSQSLHTWTIADPNFMEFRGGGGNSSTSRQRCPVRSTDQRVSLHHCTTHHANGQRWAVEVLVCAGKL